MKVSRSLLALFVLCVISCGTAATTKKIFHLSPESAEKLVEGVLKCISKLKLESVVMDLIKQGKYSEDDRVMEAFLCMNVDRGLGTAEGRINVDLMMEDLFSNIPEIRAALEACEKDYGTTPVENLKSILSCFREKTPYRLRL